MSKAPNTDDLIALICKAATEKYREDKVRPGIQIAHIPNTDPEIPALETGTAFWYVALHRYPNPRNGDTMHRDINGRALPPTCPEVRVVLHKAKHEELDRAVQLLALQLLPVEAQAELAEAIKGIEDV